MQGESGGVGTKTIQDKKISTKNFDENASLDNSAEGSLGIVFSDEVEGSGTLGQKL